MAQIAVARPTKGCPYYLVSSFFNVMTSAPRGVKITVANRTGALALSYGNAVSKPAALPFACSSRAAERDPSGRLRQCLARPVGGHCGTLDQSVASSTQKAQFSRCEWLILAASFFFAQSTSIFITPFDWVMRFSFFAAVLTALAIWRAAAD